MTQRNKIQTKRSTDVMISDAVDRQQSWLNRRRAATRAFLRRFNLFTQSKEQTKIEEKTAKESTLRAYWFPITCAIIVILIAIFVIFFRVNAPVKVIVPSVPEPIIKSVDTKKVSNDKSEITTPSFDLVRIEKTGNIVVSGRNVRESNISILLNNKVVATEHTNPNGEFVYVPKNPLKPGNYVISLIDADKNIKSADSVFVYISERGAKNSVSLLMTENGSKVMQAPKLNDGDLVVSKIDYLDSGRLVVTGRALPRLRVSLTLNDKYLGAARVSDYKTFGMGVDVDKLEPGKKYTINIRLHDTNGTTIASVKHKFVMPESTGCEDTFYTVRRGDTLWVIANNFLRNGVLFSIIADCNNIKNPDLIYPKQVLQIPVKK